MKSRIIILQIALSCFIFSNCNKDEKEKYTINIDNSEEHGDVTITPSKETYIKGENVLIAATPAEGYSFSSWEGNIPEDIKHSSEISIEIVQDIVLKPIFLQQTAGNQNLLNVNYNTEQGIVEISPQKDVYGSGDVVTLTAIPLIGYRFVNWGGDISNTSSVIELKMSKSYNINCVFEKDDVANTADIAFKLQGIYQVDSNNWAFNASVVNTTSDISIIDYEIKVDDTVLVYNNFFKKYEGKIIRESNNNAFQVSINHSSFSAKHYTITPSNFPETGSLSLEESVDKKSFTMTWVNVEADGYRITKKLISASTSAEIVITDLYNGLSKTLYKDDIWKSDFQSSDNFDKFWVWVNPVKKVTHFNEAFTNDSYIEILGRRTAIIEGTK